MLSRRVPKQAVLEAAGCAVIACNAITANNAAKALLRVAEAEAFPLSKEQARACIPDTGRYAAAARFHRHEECVFTGRRMGRP